ncbi:hypothetical protein BH09ACT7_BH09ACT7_32440 [soil metagenome]
MTSNQTILRLYIKQIVPNGDHHSASDEQVLQSAMDFAAQTGLDIDDAARSIELGAQQLDVTTNEYVAAVTTLCVFTMCSFHEASWQLRRVVNVVHQLEEGSL